MNALPKLDVGVQVAGLLPVFSLRDYLLPGS
jgi:hypothetical protein